MICFFFLFIIFLLHNMLLFSLCLYKEDNPSDPRHGTREAIFFCFSAYVLWAFPPPSPTPARDFYSPALYLFRGIPQSPPGRDPRVAVNIKFLTPGPPNTSTSKFTFYLYIQCPPVPHRLPNSSTVLPYFGIGLVSQIMLAPLFPIVALRIFIGCP